MSLRSHARRWVERALKVHVIPEEQVALVFEWDHLRHFFGHYQVDCVFDVGGNRGQYAHMLRTHVGYRGTIISYEPIPEVAAKLRAAAALHPGWLVEELALDTVEGISEFNVFASDTFSSLHETAELAQHQFRAKVDLKRRIQVRTATLAAEFRKYRERLGFERPFLKLDTQGHDVRVAMSAGAMLREFIGLQSELSIKRLYADTPDFVEALAYYRSQGFELSAFVPNNLGHFPVLLETDCIMYRAN